jgi:ribonuclease P protein component
MAEESSRDVGRKEERGSPFETERASPRASQRETFPKSARIRRGADFRRVWREGRRVEGRHVIMGLRPNPAGSRGGFVVGREVGNSVIRHRVIRLLREIYRRNRGGLEPGLDIVLRAKKGAGSSDHETLRAEILSLWGRAGILREKPSRPGEADSR